MRVALNAVAWIVLAVAFIALGADAYWSWKAEDWSFQPIGFYLRLIDAEWLAQLRDWSVDRSARTERLLNEALTWPVWGPAFAIGAPLAWFTRDRD